jgi:hypothetical protein
MTADFDSAVRSVHQANISRYRRLLATPLTSHERGFIERRLAEEEAELRKFSQPDPPLDLAMDSTMRRGRGQCANAILSLEALCLGGCDPR